MRKNFRKMACVALGVCVMAALSGCSGQQETAAESAEVEAAAEASAEEAETEETASEAETKAPEEDAAEEQTESEQSGSDESKKTDSTEESTDESSASIQAGAVVLSDGDELTGGTYTADQEDQSVVEASGTVKATVTGAVLQKTAGAASSNNDASFTGVNAGVRVYGQAEVTLEDCEISADAENATGVFAYEDGVIHISDSVINVTGGGAGGVQVAGGGTLYGNDLTVTSASKAAIRSDRGGGIMVIDGGTYTSTGSNGCPAIYSTADITVSNAECVSENSRAVIIEGKNTVTVENCTLTGNDQSTKEGSVKANVLLYQSASGDADEGTSVFTMNGGTMTSKSGAMFYVTNTASVINLSDAELILSDTGTLLQVSEGRWGNEGSNGGNCTLNAEKQTLEGNIIVDAISSLDLVLTDSSFNGAIENEGTVNLTLEEGSTWTLTGDSSVTSLDGDLSGIDLNGHKLYVNGELYEG